MYSRANRIEPILRLKNWYNLETRVQEIVRTIASDLSLLTWFNKISALAAMAA